LTEEALGLWALFSLYIWATARGRMSVPEKDFIGVISCLIELQKCDSEIRDLERKMEMGPSKINGLEEDLEVVEHELDEELGEIDSCLKEKKLFEQEIADLDRQIEKSNDKLSQIKSNKEYKAALKEIDDVKFNKGQREEKLLVTLERLEQVLPKKEINNDRKKELKASFEKERREVMADIETIKAELSELAAKRVQFTAVIEKDILGHYNLLLSRKAGIAVSPVVKGVCQSCHMAIPPQRFNELIRGEKLMECPSCRRIIYWGDDGRLKKEEEIPDSGVSE